MKARQRQHCSCRVRDVRSVAKLRPANKRNVPYPIALNRNGVKTTTTPFPIDQPITENAPPFARTCSGMISVGYSHGTYKHWSARYPAIQHEGRRTVSHVAPNVAVYKKMKAASTIPH